MKNVNGTLLVREDYRNGPEDPPSLKEMTEKAIRVLERKTRGYVLMVRSFVLTVSEQS